eukprot:356704-Chlamydomonas_euryale.AAC.5
MACPERCMRQAYTAECGQLPHAAIGKQAFTLHASSTDSPKPKSASMTAAALWLGAGAQEAAAVTRTPPPACLPGTHVPVVSAGCTDRAACASVQLLAPTAAWHACADLLLNVRDQCTRV